MSRWIPVANVADCPPGSCLELAVAGRIVAVFNVAGDFHALDGICPHQGGPLGKGQLEDGVVLEVAPIDQRFHDVTIDTKRQYAGHDLDCETLSGCRPRPDARGWWRCRHWCRSGSS